MDKCSDLKRLKASLSTLKSTLKMQCILLLIVFQEVIILDFPPFLI